MVGATCHRSASGMSGQAAPGQTGWSVRLAGWQEPGVIKIQSMFSVITTLYINILVVLSFKAKFKYNLRKPSLVWSSCQYMIYKMCIYI